MSTKELTHRPMLKPGKVVIRNTVGKTHFLTQCPRHLQSRRCKPWSPEYPSLITLNSSHVTRGLSLALPFCSPSSHARVPVNVFHREFACRRIHGIQHCADAYCLFSYRSSLCTHLKMCHGVIPLCLVKCKSSISCAVPAKEAHMQSCQQDRQQQLRMN